MVRTEALVWVLVFLIAARSAREVAFGAAHLAGIRLASKQTTNARPGICGRGAARATALIGSVERQWGSMAPGNESPTPKAIRDTDAALVYARKPARVGHGDKARAEAWTVNRRQRMANGSPRYDSTTAVRSRVAGEFWTRTGTARIRWSKQAARSIKRQPSVARKPRERSLPRRSEIRFHLHEAS